MATILIAEDDRDVLQAMCEILAAEGYRVLAAATGAAALEAFRREPANLVLSDVRMPGGDGFDLLQALRREPGGRDAVFVLVSARANQEAVERFNDVDADHFLFKPFTAAELVRLVRAMLG
jgi:CheY-like chemotaxis protein